MASPLYSIESDALPRDAHVVAFTGHEALSELYAFHIGMQTSDAHFDPTAALRAPAKLELHLGPDAKPYFISGILSAVELLHQAEGKALYRLTLGPRLWNLTQTLHSRVFTDLSIVDVIAKVLGGANLARGSYFELKLIGRYGVRDHVTQYQESDFAFISRWMEREGLYYFFEQTAGGEKLVITDSISPHAGLSSGTVRYLPTGAADTMTPEALTLFTARHAALPHDVLLTDYDYLKPALDLSGAHTVDDKGVGQLQIYGENLVSPSEAARYAQVRAQELQAQRLTFRGEGRVFHLRPGCRFQLDGHPSEALDGKGYLVTALEHLGNQSATDSRTQRLLGVSELPNEEYLVRLAAVRDDVQVRSGRRHPWPRIDGYELADICGEATSDYAQIDEHGRYKCRIFFDESELADGKATTWIRMMQPHGGGTEGFHFPLRKGTEVALFFLGGDPDRPVIAGAVPNAIKQSPINRSNHSKNVLQTGGGSLLEIEDQAGSECIHLSTPHSGTHIRLGAVRTGGGPAVGAGGAVHHARSGARAGGGAPARGASGSMRGADVMVVPPAVEPSPAAEQPRFVWRPSWVAVGQDGLQLACAPETVIDLVPMPEPGVLAGPEADVQPLAGDPWGPENVDGPAIYANDEDMTEPSPIAGLRSVDIPKEAGGEPDPDPRQPLSKAPGIEVVTVGDIVHIHRNEKIYTTGYRSEFVVRNDTKMVGGKAFVLVQGHETKVVNSGVTEVITGGVTGTIHGDETVTITGKRVAEVGGSLSERVVGAATVITGGFKFENVGGNKIGFGTGIKFELYGGLKAEFLGGVKIAVAGGAKADVFGGPALTVSAGPKKEVSPEKTILSKGFRHIGADASFTLGGAFTVDASASKFTSSVSIGKELRVEDHASFGENVTVDAILVAKRAHLG
jgi:type VI secretion system secreted protein VgrG